MSYKNHYIVRVPLKGSIDNHQYTTFISIIEFRQNEDTEPLTHSAPVNHVFEALMLAVSSSLRCGQLALSSCWSMSCRLSDGAVFRVHVNVLTALSMP